MKDRSGVVGALDVAPAVRELHKSCPDVRIHLVGHSLGGRLMAGCAKALGEAPRLQVDSLMLLEAAFSHFGFSADNGHGVARVLQGRDRQAGRQGAVRVDVLRARTRSSARRMPIMSRLAGDNTREIGDASDEFGGIGRNGPLKTNRSGERSVAANRATAYEYKPGVINNLDGSGGIHQGPRRRDQRGRHLCVCVGGRANAIVEGCGRR